MIKQADYLLPETDFQKRKLKQSRAQQMQLIDGGENKVTHFVTTMEVPLQSCPVDVVSID